MASKKDQAAAQDAAGQTDASALTGADQQGAAAATDAPEGAGGASPEASATVSAPEKASEVPTTEPDPEPTNTSQDAALAEAEPARTTYLTVVTSDRYGPAGHFLDLTEDEANEGLHPKAPPAAEGQEPGPAPDPVLAVPTAEQLARRH